MLDFQDETPLEKIWYRDLMPEVRSFNFLYCPSIKIDGQRRTKVELYPVSCHGSRRTPRGYQARNELLVKSQICFRRMSLNASPDQSVVLTPATFLPWLRKRLEDAGVTFKRLRIGALSDLEGLGHDVLVNAAGAGPLHLKDVQDQKVQHVRGQTVQVKTNYDKIMIRHGKDYTYCIPRLDGTAILGGIKQYGDTCVLLLTIQ